jgi:hypothetical protein
VVLPVALFGEDQREGTPGTCLLFEGTAQGGRVSIGSVKNPEMIYEVQTVAGDTAEQIVQKLSALPDPPFGGCKAAGPALTVPRMAAEIFFRSTDPGMAARPSVTDLRVTADAVNKAVRVSWVNPVTAPAMVSITRNGECIRVIRDKTVASYVDEGVRLNKKENTLVYRLVCVYETVIEGKYYYSCLDLIAAETDNPSYAPNDYTGAPPAIKAPPILPNGKVGEPYSYQVRNYLQDVSLFSWVVSFGTLPAGLTMSDKGLISGTPTASGIFKFRVQATDAKGRSDEARCKITIEQ